jgi:NADH-quinone oxidoreductase subunit L
VRSYAWLVPAIPFVMAFIGMLGGRRLRGGPAPIAIAGTAIATALAFALLGDPSHVHEASTLLTPTGAMRIALGTRVDGLAATVAVMVCLVALAVQVYSVAYMRGDPRYSSYAAFISLFTAAMLLVVLTNDLLVLYVGWEVMGICSYFLIGHHWEDEGNSAAAVKAFLVTKVGDVPFLFGIFVLGTAAGSFRISDIIAAAPHLSHGTIVAATLLLACGVVGKSAQFPLHTWLPDAMAGPTPISALIHAATMVAAGVYLIARLYPVFLLSPLTLQLLAISAAITMLGAALAALAQDDIKRVLAYSTVSQLAFMVGSLTVGGFSGAIFHLLVHAAFKALLFLCAGAVIHAVGTNLMSEMGGLRRAMPVTFIATTIGIGALIGMPPLSAFFSKDAILDAAWNAASNGSGTGWLVLVTGLLTIVVTAAYGTRLWLMTFFGPARTNGHEAPALMKWPVVLLAIPSAGLGIATGWLPGWIGAGGHSVAPLPGLAALSFAAMALGVGVTVSAWRRSGAADPAAALGRVRPAFDRAFYVDEAYAFTLVRPTVKVARAVVSFDTTRVDGAVEGAGQGARRLAGMLRLASNGNLQGYATGLFVGVVVIAVAAVVLR